MNITFTEYQLGTSYCAWGGGCIDKSCLCLEGAYGTVTQQTQTGAAHSTM